MGRIITVLGAGVLVIQPLAGPSAARPAADVDAYVASAMAAQHIPALSFAVIRNGAVVQSGVRGLANVELNARATDATVFAIASMSKSVTASAFMLLAQDGKLSIDDLVSRHLPDVPAAWKTMTIRHLLSHTAGVKDHFHDSAQYSQVVLDRRLSYSDEEYVKAHIEAPLNFAPGTGWGYSGGGYVILGAIIAKVTGHPYGDYLRDRIFQPLGMTHTHVISLAGIIPGRASGYWFRDGTLRNGGYSGPAHISGADVGVMTTAPDLAKWVIAISSSRLWTAASRDAMWTPATLGDGRDAVSVPAGLGYGLGWIVGTYRGNRMVGHAGTLVNGFTSTLVVFPDRQIAVIVLTNQYDANPQQIANGIAGRYESDLRPPSDLPTQPDTDAAATTRAKGFIDALLTGGDIAPFVTPGLAMHLSARWHPPAPPPGPPPEIVFIARETARPGLQRYGETVARLAHYKIQVDGDDHWFTLYLTGDGRVADHSAY